MAEVKIDLTQGHYAIVDAGDYNRINAHKWRFKLGYAIRNAIRDGRRITIYMHHEVNGTFQNGSFEIDHINGNRLDNRKSNLRVSTRQQNSFNRRSMPGTSSEYKGVYWDESRLKWRASIMVNQKRHHLGRFNSEVQAAQAYNSAAIEAFGEYAFLNVI